MLELDSTLRRQLPASGPSVLWRDREGGGREGLAFTVATCGSPACRCRDVYVQGWRVEPDAVGVEDSREQLSFRLPGGSNRTTALVLQTTVEIDCGELHPSPGFEPWALDWFRAELAEGLLPALRARFDEQRSKLPPPLSWRDTDWSFWDPGMPVAWYDAFPDETEGTELLLDGQHYMVSDDYCIVPGCECTSLQITFIPEARLSDFVGVVWLDTKAPAHPVFEAHGPALALLEKLWAAWCEENDPGELLAERLRRMHALAPELHAHLTALRLPKRKPAAAGPNERCPCGSGQKYKRCCGKKG